MCDGRMNVASRITASLSLLIFFPPVPIFSGTSLDEARLKAERGDATAQAQLGDAYDTGAGVKRDVAEAIKWYRRAAEQGNAEGQYSLGGKYDSGDGVAQDFAEALKWYRKAAEQGTA
jgi:TPR repeat protein